MNIGGIDVKVVPGCPFEAVIVGADGNAFIFKAGAWHFVRDYTRKVSEAMQQFAACTSEPKP